jgi:hypothetical protein
LEVWVLKVVHDDREVLVVMVFIVLESDLEKIGKDLWGRVIFELLCRELSSSPREKIDGVVGSFLGNLLAEEFARDSGV